MQSLAKLFNSPARLKTLRLFVFNRGTALSAAEVAQRTKLSKGIVRKELTELVAAGLVRKKKTGPVMKYETNPKFEYLDALDSFVRDTTNVHPEKLTAALRKAGALRLVALSGLFMGVIESQVDLLVVGDRLNERVLKRIAHGLEAELGREIRYASFTTENFRYRLGVYDRLLRDVFDYPHRLLIDKIGL